jgi:hypothetical protein
LIETDSSDLVAGAIYRAARTDEAIARGTVVGAEPPPISDLTDLSTTVLAELALAEDQAGFIGQYFAAQLPAGIDRLALAAEAEYHQALGQLLLDLSGEDDPRQPAYQLPAINLETVPAAWADTLLALASHYAAVPAPSATDPMVTYLLVQAHRLGADPPALPFLA